MTQITKRLTKLAAYDVNSIVKQVSLAIGGVVLLTLGSKLEVPMWPVPLTMQTAAVMVVALMMRPRLAGATVLAWLLATAAGLPLCAGAGAGPAFMTGPSGGYLLGMLIAGPVMSALALGRGTPGRIFAMIAGLGVIYAFGLVWLGFYVPANKIIALGFTPFIVGAVLKVVLVAAVVHPVPARFLGR